MIVGNSLQQNIQDMFSNIPSTKTDNASFNEEMAKYESRLTEFFKELGESNVTSIKILMDILDNLNKVGTTIANNMSLSREERDTLDKRRTRMLKTLQITVDSYKEYLNRYDELVQVFKDESDKEKQDKFNSDLLFYQNQVKTN